MATATASKKTLRSFRLACTECGSQEGLTLDLNDLTAVSCSGCGESYSPETARRKAIEQAKRWSAVCGWLALAGTATDETGDEIEAD